MKIWDSESENKLNDATGDIWTVMLDDTNGVLILASYPSTGAHYLTLLFFGPGSEVFGKTWMDAVQAMYDNETDDIDMLTNEPQELIRRVLGVPEPE